MQLHRSEIAASAGAPLSKAQLVVIMIHGRGATAQSITLLSDAFEQTGVAYVAPQASNGTWYPNSFLAPLDSNEPWLTSALGTVAGVLEQVTAARIAIENVVLLGFSQGACLASEFVARNPARYGGLVALSGGLIGPDGTPREYEGSLHRMPAFFGCSDTDPHIPVARVHESARVLADMGADVEERIYPGFGHAVNQDEIDWVKKLLARLGHDWA